MAIISGPKPKYFRQINYLIGVVLAANEVKENPEAGVDAIDVTAPVAIGGLVRFPKGVVLDDPPPNAIP